MAHAICAGGFMSDMTDWKFSHDEATAAEWTPGLREIFKYRDLGIEGGTKGDYVAHLVRHNGKAMKDDVQHWHVQYAGHGQRTIRKGDCINQIPGIPHREIACSEDFEVLEIVAPANFKTRIVEAPAAHAEAAE